LDLDYGANIVGNFENPKEREMMLRKTKIAIFANGRLGCSAYTADSKSRATGM